MAATIKVRGPYLARLETHKRMRDLNLNADNLLGDYQELLLNYFRLFGNKKCCANDLKKFLDYLEAGRRPELASKLIQDTGISSTTLPQDVSTIRASSQYFNIYLDILERPTSTPHLLTSNFSSLRSSFVAISRTPSSALLSFKPPL